MTGFKKIFLSVILVLTLSVCMIYSDSVSQSVLSSLRICLEIIIPSMYGFMIVSDLIIRCGVHKVISVPFRLISEYVFRLPCEMFSIFLISCFAGYPVGIKMIYNLLDRGETDRSTAEYMSCFCFSCGPAFISGTVCSRLYSDKRAGLIIFASILSANIITALIMRTGRKIPHGNISFKGIPASFSAQNIVLSVDNSARSVFSICSMIVAFSVFSGICSSAGIFSYAAEMICRISGYDYQTSYSAVMSFFEISNVSSFPSENYSLLPLVTALLSFGGICVLIQITAVSGGRLKMTAFLISRILSSVLSYFICGFVIKKLNICVSVSCEYSARIYSNPDTAVPSVFLIIMTIILMYSISHSRKLS